MFQQLLESQLPKLCQIIPVIVQYYACQPRPKLILGLLDVQTSSTAF